MEAFLLSSLEIGMVYDCSVENLKIKLLTAESETVLLSNFKIEAFLLSSLEIGMVYDFC